MCWQQSCPSDTTGLSRGASRWLLHLFSSLSKLDATGLSRGASCSLLFSFERETPRRKAVASSFSAWNHECSDQRENSTAQARGILSCL